MNDLNRLLDDAVPEPRGALSAGDLVRRARRRRTTRTVALGAVTATAVVAGFAVAAAVTGPGGTLRPPAASATPAGSPSIHGSPGTPGDWPPMEKDLSFCQEPYPGRLTTFPVAFDGTVTAVRTGDRPTVELAVHHVYDGPPRESVTLVATPQDFPADAQSIVGMRVLVAAPEELTLVRCGYTRPWDPHVATAWQHAYDEPDDCGLWRTRLYFPGYHETDYTGLTVDDATALARSRDLEVRLVGDGVQAVTDDLREKRVNLCNRRGVVTAAVRS